jgi:hypothetical protein
VIAQSHGVTMKALGLKFTEKVLIVLSFSLLAHYFVLTFFRVDGTESFVGKVEKIDFISKGLFPMAKVKFAVINNLDGDQNIVEKSISLTEKDVLKFKIGRKYKIKSHHNWLVSYR